MRLARADGEYRLIVAAAKIHGRQRVAHLAGVVADDGSITNSVRFTADAEAELTIVTLAPTLDASRRLDQRARVPPASYDGEHRLIVAAT